MRCSAAKDAFVAKVRTDAPARRAAHRDVPSTTDDARARVSAPGLPDVPSESSHASTHVSDVPADAAADISAVDAARGACAVVHCALRVRPLMVQKQSERCRVVPIFWPPSHFPVFRAMERTCGPRGAARAASRASSRRRRVPGAQFPRCCCLF